MASLEKRGDNFRIIFRYAGQRHQAPLKTSSDSEASQLIVRIERKLALLAQGDIVLPQGVDIESFLLSEKPKLSASTALKTVVPAYQQSRQSIEANSLATIKLHLAHIQRFFGASANLNEITFSRLQDYVNERVKKVSAITVRKEVTSLSGLWSWAVRTNRVRGGFPNRGLEYPKTDEKPPFQTWPEIERKIKNGADDKLWDCLFLSTKEIAELLKYTKKNCTALIHAMVTLAAHTGARRSELLRVRLEDVDFSSNTVTIREKKRVQGRNSLRQVPMSGLLTKVMKAWMKDKTGEIFGLTRDQAHDKFQKAFAGSKWEMLKGWHVLRHSFASNCAAQGLDQRIIDTWMGHQTEEQRKRYRHLFPHQQRQAIDLVFA